jgi:hypothetical protein
MPTHVDSYDPAMNASESTSLNYEARPDARPVPTFCPQCIAATTEDSAGNSVTVNFVGTGMFGEDCACPTCGSVVSTKWATFLFPLVPLKSYRVIELSCNE